MLLLSRMSNSLIRRHALMSRAPAVMSCTRDSTSRYFSSRAFDKVLIANRGEIASRVMRTCHEMDIQTVAIYTTMDAKAPFVQDASESVCIGSNYLDTNRIQEALLKTGSQAIHPGYGFLSENADFAFQIEQMPGVTWLGPSSSAIQDMGNKLRSKEIALEAGVSILQGHDGIVPNVETALEVANDIGYPVLLKAAAGGGGKGMRICYNDADIVEGFPIATQEAVKFFANDGLLVEKYMQDPHHIEFQVLSGTNPSTEELDVVVFCERECSIQRRNQKIIEESPSCLLLESTRRDMVNQVKELVRTVGYTSAGTVEFLVDNDQNFFFLEMNTRLQVEHPVTEMVSSHGTNIDLVKGMLHVGAGWGLPPEFISENYVMPYKGHAIEARIYAEDPLRGFLPSTGPLIPYQEPPTGRFDSHELRVDSGVAEGFHVSPHYDPMLSKIISYSPNNRKDAIDGLVQALDHYVIEGVQHNARLCNDVLRHAAFQAGKTPTSFLQEHYPNGWRGVELSLRTKAQLVVAASFIQEVRQQVLDLPSLVSSFSDGIVVKLGGMFGEAYHVQEKKEPLLEEASSCWIVSRLDVTPDTDDVSWTVHVNESLEYSPNDVLAKIVLDNTPLTLQVLRHDLEDNLQVQLMGANVKVLIQTMREYELSKHMKPPKEIDMSHVVPSPMPGTLISYAVEEGDSVELGQELCIVEAMKMQNVIRAPRAGIISKCRIPVGSSLMADEILVDFLPQQEEQVA